MTSTLYSYSLLLLLVLSSVIQIVEGTQKFVPPGMDGFWFPEPVYDADAPECSKLEPCGFYSFSLQRHSPFKWIKSWCQCGSDYDCVYDRADMKMRVYRQLCKLRSERLAEEANA